MGSIEENTVETTVGEFLLRRLYEAGCEHLFGVPGDFVLGFFNQLLKSKVKFVGTCNELNAAYAADGYARFKGIGCLSTTYCVGELSAINGVAGSFAERVPVVSVTGVPSTTHYKRRTLLHHTLGDYTIPQKMYAMISVADTLLDRKDTAAAEIDRVLTACLEEKRPVYIALPSDMCMEVIRVPASPFVMPALKESDPEVLEEAVLEILNHLHRARSPILVPGVEIIRFGLQKQFKALVEASGLPYATMMLGKTVLDEEHPQFIGLYQGDRSRPYVRERVESADCTLVLGEKLTDFNTGGFTAVLDNRCTIHANVDSVRVSFHTYNRVHLCDLMISLAKRVQKRDLKDPHLNLKSATDGCTHRRTLNFCPEVSKALTMGRFFDRISHFLPENGIAIAETGASLFSAAEVMMPRGTTFIGQTFYGSIGYTVGATLGCCLARPDRKVVLFVGDGSFQVTCQDLSTMIRYNCKPVIFLVNNDGYTIERVITDHSYNDIQPWKYHELTKIFGGGVSFDCFTEGDLEAALQAAASADQLVFIEVHFDRWDCNDALRRAGEAMARNNKLV